MKTKLILLMVIIASALNAQNKLTVVIDGIEEMKGHILLGIYDEENYMTKFIDAKMEKADGETVTFVCEDIASGEYAISVFHDENDNKKLDTGAFGIPKEKYGFSNNAKGKMGPPSFQDCMFKVEEDTEIYITLTKVTF